jgi:AraC-like DNA-binding protein
MSFQRALTTFPDTLEKRYSVADITTGFALKRVQKGTFHENRSVEYNYVVFILSGACRITTSVCINETVRCGYMFLIPINSPLKAIAVEETEFLTLAFKVPIIKKNTRLLEYCSDYTARFPYKFCALPICDEIYNELLILIHNMKMDKIKDMKYYLNKNEELLIYFESYYSQQDVANFLYPIIGINTDFKTLIYNNYKEVSGNITNLQLISGLSSRGFQLKFKKEFGMPAKQWMQRQQAMLLKSLAEREGATPQMMALQLHLPTYLQLNRICKKAFGCPPGELIERSKKNSCCK